MGQTVIRHLLESPYIEKIYIYDINPDSLNKAKEIDEKVELVFNIDEILGNSDILVTFIASANHTHKDLTISCLKAGKAVLCEKPMATNWADAVEMVETAERLNCFLQIGFEMRYSKLYTTVKKWIDDGLLGDVLNTHCDYCCSEFHGKGSWRNKKKTAGGMFMEKLCHYVDAPRWWIGDKVEDVFSVCAPNIVKYKEVHDNFHTICRYSQGQVSELTFMMGPAETFDGDPLQDVMDQQKEDGHALRFFIYGTKGAAETDVFKRSLKRWEFGDSSKCFTSKLVECRTWEKDEDHFYFHNTTDQTLDVVERVVKGCSTKTSARDSLESMRVSYAAELSADERRIIRISEIA